MSGVTSVNRAAAESLGLDAATTELLVTGIGLIHILQVYTSSMVAVAVWDWLVCLNAEYNFIWKKEWSVIKCLYLWTRYYGLACFSINLWLFNANFSAEQCKTLHYLIAATCMWTTLGSEAILAVRTYAFFGKQRWLAIILGILLTGETAFLLYVSIAGVGQIDPIPIGDARSPCTASDKPGQHVVSGFWLAPVAFDLICTFLTAWKAWSLQASVMSSRIVSVFIREGLFYFVAVAAVNVLNAAFMFQKNPNLQNINCFLALVLSQVLCCRLVLNLKGTQERSTSFSSTEQHSGFVPHPRSNVSIPLRNYHPTDTTFTQNDIYDGVKVQVGAQVR
ncbi:hypothetical protein FA13DRAFT_1762161 [Coprinellus micaceus]|uniref:DUF6533 domain-containing protein n=1 Tax=Coprinellus micaceus TaxID=71717 RepID=A0A4Y7TP04_COPMI|nr:hypothetical protein FA13DRAFT_1762161 [Coprinellus micaceus]